MINLTKRENSYNFKYHYFGANTYLEDINYNRELLKLNQQNHKYNPLYMLNKKELISQLNEINIAKIYNDIFEILNEIKNKDKNEVHIEISFDNNIIGPLSTVLTSMFETKLSSSYYILHYLITTITFNELNYKKILSFQHQYAGFEIIYHDMGNLCTEFPTELYATASYYRLQLENIINDTDKILHLDIDTVVLDDLYQFYSIDMEDKLYKGVLDHYYFDEYYYD